MVTGLTGFKGLWLGAWLERLGAKVFGLALEPTEATAAAWPRWEERFRVRIGDIRDANVVDAAMAECEPEIIFHLAAQSLVRQGYADPAATFASNVMGTVHVLEAARRMPSVRAVVVVTSDKCYENREWHWGYRETDRLGGRDPYSASKACSELVTAAYRDSFTRDAGGWSVATARAGNVIGGGDWAEDRLVPDLVRAIAAGEPVELRHPNATRPWQHVLEPLSGYLMLGKALCGDSGKFGGAWNFGPADAEAINVRQLANRFAEIWGGAEIIETGTPDGPHEARCLQLDSSKSRAELGWRPLLCPDERLAWTVDWYKAAHKYSTASWRVTEQQIEAFEGKVASCPEFQSRWSAASAVSSAPTLRAA